MKFATLKTFWGSLWAAFYGLLMGMKIPLDSTICSHFSILATNTQRWWFFQLEFFILRNTWHEIWICSRFCFMFYAFFFTSPNICFYIALDAEQIPYINHLMEKLMHMTVDIATSSSVGIDDSILVGDDKSHFDRWNVKKLLFLLR